MSVYNKINAIKTTYRLVKVDDALKITHIIPNLNTSDFNKLVKIAKKTGFWRDQYATDLMKKAYLDLLFILNTKSRI